MIKKITAVALAAILLTIGQAAYAEETTVISADSELYETVREMEEATYDLTEDVENKLELHEEYAEKRLLEAEEQLDQGDEASAEALINEYSEYLDQSAALLEEAAEEIDQESDHATDEPTDESTEAEEAEETEEERPDLEVLQARVRAQAEKSSANLTRLLAREDLPESAKAGIAKALENKGRATEKRLAKLERKAAKWAAKESMPSIEEPEETNEEVIDAPEPVEDPVEKAPEVLPETDDVATEEQAMARVTTEVADPDEATVETVKKAETVKPEKEIKSADKKQKPNANANAKAKEKAKGKK